MKIIFLNSWYGKVGKNLFTYLDSQSKNTDIFCFSEVDPDFYTNLQKTLPEFKSEFTTNKIVESLGHLYAQAIFYRKGVNCINFKKIDIYRNVYNDVGFCQVFDLISFDKTIKVVNVHGKARPGHKKDTPARLKQSKKIIDSLKDWDSSKIIGGDFNLNPDTKSVAMFEENGYRNLIKEFDIKDTRGKINAKIYEGREIQKFADYCFTTPDIKIKSFNVPDVEVSDHLPLVLEFDL